MPYPLLLALQPRWQEVCCAPHPHPSTSLPCHFQNDAAATHAAKLTREEAVLDFSQPAAVCHNKVRAFVPWPGTFATFAMVDPSSSSSNGSESSSSGSSGETIELKIVRTRVGQPSSWQGGSEREVAATKDALLIRCADGSVLEVRAALSGLGLVVPGFF